jgi:hypothetical protein
MAGLTTYFIQPPPLPPPLQAVYGPVAPIEVPVSDRDKGAFSSALTQQSSGVTLSGVQI